MGSEVSMPCSSPDNRCSLEATARHPLAVSPTTTCMQARSIIDQHLLETGSLLLQGLPITNPEACEAFVNGMGFTPQKYEPYGGTRQKVRP